MGERLATRPWRALRPLDAGARVVVTPTAGVHYDALLTHVYPVTDPDNFGLVDVRYSDGATGTWPMVRVSLAATTPPAQTATEETR